VDDTISCNEEVSARELNSTSDAYQPVLIVEALKERAVDHDFEVFTSDSLPITGIVISTRLKR
jgi:hypothetical protein